MVIVYGIPNCSTVKRAREWLKDRGQDHQFVDFRKTPVGRERISTWVDGLGSKSLKNTSGASYRALPPERASWTEEQWIDAFVADPMLIRRPVFEVDGAPVQAGFRRTEPLEERLSSDESG